jgi:nitrate reductase gamma subunit
LSHTIAATTTTALVDGVVLLLMLLLLLLGQLVSMLQDGFGKASEIQSLLSQQG